MRFCTQYSLETAKPHEEKQPVSTSSSLLLYVPPLQSSHTLTFMGLYYYKITDIHLML